MDKKTLEQVLKGHPEAGESADRLLEHLAGADFNALVHSLANKDIEGVYASLDLTKEEAQELFKKLADAGKELSPESVNGTAPVPNLPCKNKPQFALCLAVAAANTAGAGDFKFWASVLGCYIGCCLLD